MQKKQYTTPATTTYRLEAQPVMNPVSTLPIDRNNSNGVSSENELLSRQHFNVWDDEESEAE